MAPSDPDANTSDRAARLVAQARTLHKKGALDAAERLYRDVLAHGRQAVPPGAMLEVDYEALVDDFEGHVRRIVAHCGLAWDGACLDFHTRVRPVRTASLAPVRQPVNRASIGRWRPDQAMLEPLIDALGDAAGAPS
jgi:Sulfotransferase family